MDQKYNEKVARSTVQYADQCGDHSNISELRTQHQVIRNLCTPRITCPLVIAVIVHSSFTVAKEFLMNMFNRPMFERGRGLKIK
jgi:hypothetical protein